MIKTKQMFMRRHVFICLNVCLLKLRTYSNSIISSVGKRIMSPYLPNTGVYLFDVKSVLRKHKNLLIMIS
jgi:hypothetical protein